MLNVQLTEQQTGLRTKVIKRLKSQLLIFIGSDILLLHE